MSKELEDFLQRRDAVKQSQARILVEAAGGASPDDAAKRLRAAREQGTTPSIGGAIGELQSEVGSALEGVQRSPALQRWLARGTEQAAVARGDFKTLADTSEVIAAPKPRTALGRVEAVMSMTGMPQGSAAIGWVLGAIDKTYRGITSGEVTPETSGQAVRAGAASTVGGIAGEVEAGLQVLGFEDAAAFTQQRRQAWERAADLARPKVQDEGARAVLGGIEALPANVLALAGGAALKSAKAGAMLIGSIAGGTSYGEAVDAGLSHERALLYGGVDWAIEAGTELAPFEALLSKSTAGFGQRLMRTLGAELPGEQLATLGQDLNAFLSLPENKDATWGDFLAARPDAAYQTLVASVIGSTVMTTAVEATNFALDKMGRNVGRAANVEETERFAEALGRLASASKVLQRDKGSFEEFVAEASAESEVTTVFVEAAELSSVLDQSGLTVEEIYEATGILPEELVQMAERGEDVAIPVEQYASSIAPTPLNDALMPHIRLDPDDMSRTQAETFLQSAQQEFEADATAALEIGEQQNERAVSRAWVEERILEELNTARRFTSDVNQVYATVVGSFFDTMAQRSGMTAQELAERYGLKVQSGEVAEPTFDQMKPTLNIGMDIPAERGGGQLTADQVREALERAGFGINEITEQQSDSERTAVVQLVRPMSDAELDALSEALGQEAIPQFANGQGTMRGPMAEKWGPFNPEFFLLPDGTRLAQSAVPLTETAAFKAWFGDSKVVDANGDPLVVYHGTDEDIDAFDRGIAYFSDDSDGAGRYGSDILPVYLSLQNPYYHDDTLFNPTSDFLAEVKGKGHDGIVSMGEDEGERYFIAFSPEQIKSVDNRGTFDPADPNIYNQSAAPLQTLPMRVQGTGPGGRVRNWDLGEALTLRHRAQYGRPLDPTDPTEYQVALDALLEDYADQQAQPDNGEAWYSDDIAEAVAITTRILPELEDPVRRDIFLTAVALLSPQRGPVDNWSNAIVAMTGYSRTGRFALEHEDGTQFGVKSHSTGLALFQHLIEQEGEIGALVWLSSEHTGAEMEAVRRASGLFRNKADNYLPKETNKTESKLGVYIFGPKVGDFMLNSAGLDQSAVTVDLWMARTYNRVIGRLTDVNEKQAAEGGLADAMRGKAERAIVKQLVRDAAQQVGIAPSAMQAALWYFEQRLYRNHGIQSDSTSFSDAAREAAANRGIDVDGVTAQGSQPRGDEAESGDLEEGVRVYFQGDPLDAFKRESYFPSRAVRHADGTVYADIPAFYPDRQARLAAEIGAEAVVAVGARDARLYQGVPLWHSVPLLEPDGTLRLDHWGPAGITETDPARWGESGTAPRSERQAISGGLPRTFFGIASGQPGGYIIEFPGRTQYSAFVDPATIYDVAADPDKLKPAATVAELERKIKAAGYIGYWTADPQLGLVATVFEPLSVKPAGAQTLYQDAVFFSALERSLENTATNKASAQQWKATLEKTPGIKAEELEWTGLLEFLEMQDGAITREQLLEVVRGAGLRVDEVVLGYIPERDSRRAEDRLQQRLDELAREAGFEEGTPEYDEYVEENYSYELDSVLDAMRAEPRIATQFASWSSDPQNETYRELLITLPIGEGRNPNRAPSTHWDTDGVIAHARFMDKTDADGKRVLFIEEVQSDWHQKGRDQGYEVTEIDKERATRARIRAEELTAEFTRLQTEIEALPVDAIQTNAPAYRELRDRRETVDLQRQEALLEARNAARQTGIPNAPFRTDWPSLVMKRMIRWAAEHGYERIAWTTGEQQAERYNLSQAVGLLSAAREADGRLKVIVGNSTARNTIRQQFNLSYQSGQAAGDALVITDEQAKEIFGENIATTLGERADAANGEYGPPLEGDDLRVGGEGMKAFYDRNLVNITNKLVKKYGARVGAVQVVNEAEVRLAEQNALYTTSGKADLSRGTDIQPGFDITPELADAAMGGFPLFQRDRGPRGQIAFAPDITAAPSVITLLRGADLSTFVHELGHFMFEVTNDMASRAGAPADVVEMRDTMLRYLGVESATEWENRTPAQRRDGHERIARSFEAYLFEGRAPSTELQSLFSRLRSWMLQVYRTITRLNVELTDEVRGAFDRMLASDDAIAEAQADAEMRPLFAEKPPEMSDADWAEYQSMDREATTNASEALSARSMRDMRYAGRSVAREIKRLQKQVAEQRRELREEVEAEVSEQPIYRAISFFRTGELDGEPWEGEHKLNTGLVREALALGSDPIPDALKGMTNPEGLHPEQAAELFGFTSADHLLKDLLFAPPLRDAVDAETDQRMKERYGDLNTPEDVEEAARAAVHNEVRGRFAATELAALQKAPGRKRVLNEAAKRIAQGTIARLRIRDLRPGQYEAAERRAAREAARAGTAKLDDAVRHTRNRLLQFHLAKAAHEAKQEAQKARDYLRKFDVKGTRANIDVDFLDQIDQLLERFDLRQVSNKAADRRRDLGDWVEKMRAEGFEPALDPETLRDIGRKPWRELTVEEMRGVVDAVRNIEHLGRVTKKLFLAKDKADLDTAAAEMAQSVRDNAARSIPEIIGSKSWWERVKSGGADFFAMHRKVANMVHVFDGTQYGGVFWERFIRPMNERGDWETSRNAEVNLRLAEVFKLLGKQDTTKREYIPEIDRSLSLEDRLMFALNMGNAANLQRLLDGDRLEYAQLEAIIAPLTAQHWDFVEAVWTEIDSFWPEIAAKERRVTGNVPEKVEAQPFQVEVDGELRLIRGGYFPIKYDPDRSSKAAADDAAEVLKQMTRGLYASAQTRKGHTKERVDEVKGRPLRKSFSVIFSHASQVVHDLAWHEYLIDANRLLRHGAVDAAVREHYGPETLKWMRKALEDIAIGDLQAMDAFDAAVNHIRTGASIAAMGWNLWTSLLQPVGLTQSIARIGVKHVAKGIGNLLSNPAKMNAKINWIYEVSPFMRERGNTMQREINEIRNRIKAKSPVRKAFDKLVPIELSGVVADSYFVMIAKAQLIADLPTWLGQYEKSLAAGETEDRAVAIADQAVIDSQGAGQIKDLAGIQRGGPLMKLWTNFYSYFSATMNLMADRTAELRRKGVKDLPYYAVDIALLTALPATVSSIMYSVLREGLDLGDDDDREEIVKKLAADNASYLAGTMIGLRETAAVFSGYAGYSGPAGARAFAELARFGKQVEQGEADEALARSANSLAGILLHYPAGQLDRTVRGIKAVAEGDAGPMAILMGPPPK